MNRLQHLTPILASLITILHLSATATVPLAVSPFSAQTYRPQLEQLLATGRVSSSGEPIRQQVEVREVYAREQYKPLWTPEKAMQLLAATEASREDGLQPHDYHVQALLHLGRHLENDSASHLSAEDDLLLSDALLYLRHDKLYGKVDPKTLFPNWNLNNPRKAAASGFGRISLPQRGGTTKMHTCCAENARLKHR